ncbi:DUF4833 domain-containing protein [Pedobacter sp.]|uniref:DUF4833 domain-containing protein n=1 Tax=Pedobacter sp. TaxID=1411316 RepID=UPI003BA986DF
MKNKKTSSKYKFLVLFAFLLLLIVSEKLSAQIADPSPLTFPNPGKIENMLFYLQRDPNINTLIYAVNTNKTGDINKEKPISIYWIRYTEKGEKKELGYIQRKFAYGLTTKELSKNKFEIRFVSYKSLPLYLSQTNSEKKYQVTVTVNGKTISINRLFVRIEGGSFWLPNVKYALVEGIELATGKNVTEKISIK